MFYILQHGMTGVAVSKVVCNATCSFYRVRMFAQKACTMCLHRSCWTTCKQVEKVKWECFEEVTLPCACSPVANVPVAGTHNITCFRSHYVFIRVHFKTEYLHMILCNTNTSKYKCSGSTCMYISVYFGKDNPECTKPLSYVTYQLTL